MVELDQLPDSENEFENTSTAFHPHSKKIKEHVRNVLSELIILKYKSISQKMFNL